MIVDISPKMQSNFNRTNSGAAILMPVKSDYSNSRRISKFIQGLLDDQLVILVHLSWFPVLCMNRFLHKENPTSCTSSNWSFIAVSSYERGILSQSTLSVQPLYQNSLHRYDVQTNVFLKILWRDTYSKSNVFN